MFRFLARVGQPVAARIGRSAVDLAIGTPRLQKSRSDASKNLQQSTYFSRVFGDALAHLFAPSSVSLTASLGGGNRDFQIKQERPESDIARISASKSRGSAHIDAVYLG